MLPWVLARSLAYVVNAIINAIGARNCVSRKRTLYVRLGQWMVVKTSKAEEFDHAR